MGLTIFSPIGVQILFFLEGIAHGLPRHADKHIGRPPAFKFVKNEKKKKKIKKIFSRNINVKKK